MSPMHGLVVEKDEARVQNLRIDEFETRLWLAGIDRPPASAAKD
jgi:hypothetical protein